MAALFPCIKAKCGGRSWPADDREVDQGRASCTSMHLTTRLTRIRMSRGNIRIRVRCHAETFGFENIQMSRGNIRIRIRMSRGNIRIRIRMSRGNIRIRVRCHAETFGFENIQMSRGIRGGKSRHRDVGHLPRPQRTAVTLDSDRAKTPTPPALLRRPAGAP
jgi:hypothetical protein